MARSQERYAKQANKRRRGVDFAVKDKVWVTAKHWKTDRPSRKLANQMEDHSRFLCKWATPSG
jgi:hypothetical protein